MYGRIQAFKQAAFDAYWDALMTALNALLADLK
jgi:hypothetical protein